MKSMEYITDNETVNNHPYISDCLIYDIETDSLDHESASVKWFGAYSYKTHKYYICTGDERSAIQRLLSEHRVLIGFNNKDFDNPILINNGYDIDYKIIADCMRVLYNPDYKRNNRKVIIEMSDGRSLAHVCKTNKLRDVAAALGFDTVKGDIDYKIFRQNSWTPEEVALIESYLFKDIKITRQLWEFYVTYFDSFKEYVDEENIRKFNYIRSSLGSYTYSAICNMTGIECKYHEGPTLPRMKFKGAYVVQPDHEYTEGTIVLKDYASLYPHIFIQCNLYGATNKFNAWTGDSFFEIKGRYDRDEQSPVSALIKNILDIRLKYKAAHDPRHLPLKIVLNTAYGITGNPNFIQIVSEHNAEDCTAIGVQCIKYAHKVFEENGFKILYGDTDSCFILVPPDRQVEELDGLSNRIIGFLQAHMPFPVDTWKFSTECIIKKLWMFHKKQYIYLTDTNKFVIKGLSIIKSDASELGQLIFERLKPLIKERQDIKFDKTFIEELINEEIQKNILLIGQVYNVRKLEDYKSKTGLHAQIAACFGEGLHVLIPNKSLGQIGQSKKYATIEEAKQLNISDLLLEKVYNELEPFIK